jgi:hypothetical protein
MKEWIRDTLISRLHGTYIHLEPVSAIVGLTESNARISCKCGRSVHELLYHIVFWLDYSLALLNGEVMEHNNEIDWEIRDTKWNKLVARFSKGLSQLEFIAENWELDKEIKIGDKISTCVGAEILGIIQHTSYHLGQIVSTRRALGLWPT